MDWLKEQLTNDSLSSYHCGLGQSSAADRVDQDTAAANVQPFLQFDKAWTGGVQRAATETLARRHGLRADWGSLTGFDRADAFVGFMQAYQEALPNRSGAWIAYDFNTDDAAKGDLGHAVALRCRNEITLTIPPNCLCCWHGHRSGPRTEVRHDPPAPR